MNVVSNVVVSNKWSQINWSHFSTHQNTNRNGPLSFYENNWRKQEKNFWTHNFFNCVVTETQTINQRNAAILPSIFICRSVFV